MPTVLRIGVLFLVLFTTLSPLTFSQSRKEKKEAKIAESGQPKNIAGGVKLAVEKSYAESYDMLLNWLKRSDYMIESANREIGQIVTAMTVTGGYSQTGTRIMVTLIKDSDVATTVKVVVSEQKRKKLLSTEPWGEAKPNDKETQKIADQVKALLQ